MYCNWVMHFGDYCFITDCGKVVGKDVQSKRKVCFCGKRINRIIQTN